MSTIVMAPIRKTSISQVLPKAPSRSEDILAWSKDGSMDVEKRLRRLHIRQQRRSATDDLLMLILFSMAISTYAKTKTTTNITARFISFLTF